MSEDQRIPKIVLTGGPCGGKSTAQAMLRDRLIEYGIFPLLVPEISTYLHMTNFSIAHVAGAYPHKMREVQKQILQYQLMLEARQAALAGILEDRRVVLICDRGAMDGQAYVGREEFTKLVFEMGLTIEGLRDKQYQAVCHIVTAAQGAEEFYSNDNPARKESAEEARALDNRTLEAWMGHEHLSVIRNTKGGKLIDFETKKNEILRWACHALGIPEPLEIERKFLVSPDFAVSGLPLSAHRASIKQIYLKSAIQGITRRVRMRQDMNVLIPGEAIYTYTEKERVSDETAIERERIISPAEFLTLLMERDTTKGEIQKIRHSFIHGSQYFQLDVFLNLPEPLIVLEAELTDEAQELDLPPFLPIEREVTDDPRYKNVNLANSIYCDALDSR